MSFLKYMLISFPFIGNKILSFFVKMEKGQLYSKTIRKFFESKYDVKVDLFTYGSCFSKNFNLGGKVIVGRYCSFAENVRYFAGNHPISNITTSPIFYNKSLGFDVDDIQRGNLVIEDDVWLGYNTTILFGCTRIGRGAIIAANTTVTHDVPPYSIVAGTPARVIRNRFSEKEIQYLEKSEWWKLEPIILNNYYKDMKNPIHFSEQIIRYRG